MGCDDCEVVASSPPLMVDEKNKNSAEGERMHLAHPSLTFLFVCFLPPIVCFASSTAA